MKSNNLFLFTGEETFLLQEKLRMWKEKFIEKYDSDMNVSCVDATNYSLSEIISECCAVPFLGDKRLVIIDSFVESRLSADGKEVEMFLENLKNIPDSTVCVFVIPKVDKRKKCFSYFKKQAVIEDFKPLSDADLYQWIQKRCGQKGISINPNACRLLAALTTGDLWKLSQELQKLEMLLRSEQRKEIREEDVKAIATSSAQANIFAFTDALGSRNHKQSLRSLSNLLDGQEDPIYVFHMIVRHFRLLILVKEWQEQRDSKMDKKSLLSAFRIHPFVFSKLQSQMSAFNVKELRDLYSVLLHIEKSLKNGAIPYSATPGKPNAILELLFEKWIIKHIGKKFDKTDVLL